MNGLKNAFMEGLEYEDLKGLIDNNITIDLHKPKIGSEDETVVVSFLVKHEEPAKDLTRFIETGTLEHLDVETSTVPNADGNYRVYVEFQRDSSLFKKMNELLNSVDQITSREGDWTYRAYNVKKKVKFNQENFKRDIIDSRREYKRKVLKKRKTENQ